MNSIPVIKATNVTTFRNNLNKQLGQVSKDDVTLIVTRNGDKNVVVMSKSAYEALIKTVNNLTYDLKLFKSAQKIMHVIALCTNLIIFCACIYFYSKTPYNFELDWGFNISNLFNILRINH